MEKQEKKYDLKNDIIFKTFFLRKGNEEFLIDFLNSLLKIEIVKIEIQEEVNLEQLAKEEKGGRLDLQATLNDGVIVNIELQMKDEHNIQERTSLYASKVISRETAIVLDKHREYEVMDNIQWYYIELPKFREQNPDMDEKINQWIAFIDGERKELVEVAEKKNKKLQKAREEMNYLTGDAAIRRLTELIENYEEIETKLKDALTQNKAKAIESLNIDADDNEVEE